jgi:dihydrofolate reductase
MAAAADKLCGPEGTDPVMTRLPLFGTKIRVAGCGGLRLGEQNTLRAIDVFFDRGYVHINGSWITPRAQAGFRGPVKNHTLHEVPLPRSLMHDELLPRVKELIDLPALGNSPNGSLGANRNDARPIEVGGLCPRHGAACSVSARGPRARPGPCYEGAALPEAQPIVVAWHPRAMEGLYARGMGLLTFSINVTLDGCVDHQVGIADDETHAYFTRLLDGAGAMLWGRVTYEMMESYWPAVARGDEEAPPAIREWAVTLEAKPKYVVSSTRSDFSWTNSHHLTGGLPTTVEELKDATPAGVLLGSGKLATELDRLDLIDEYQFLVHPRIAGHGPTLFESGLPDTRRLDLVSAEPLRNGAVALHYRRAH